MGVQDQFMPCCFRILVKEEKKHMHTLDQSWRNFNLLDCMISKHANSERANIRHNSLIDHNDLFCCCPVDRLLYKAAPLGISTVWRKNYSKEPCVYIFFFINHTLILAANQGFLNCKWFAYQEAATWPLMCLSLKVVVCTGMPICFWRSWTWSLSGAPPNCWTWDEP